MGKLILPYREDMAKSDGCYITPEGEFLLSGGSHALYSMNNFKTEKEFRPYYLDQKRSEDAIAEYAVVIKQYDRLRTVGVNSNLIQSSEIFSNIRFFNWILMDWPIIYLQAKEFYGNVFSDYVISKEELEESADINGNLGIELKRIKKDVPVLERTRFFK